jgi:hypothetical protein
MSSGGHWKWTAFDDHRGRLGGFNYFLCPDGKTRFSMDPTKDPAKECNPNHRKGDPIYISTEETDEKLLNLRLPGIKGKQRWCKLGDPDGVPDWLNTTYPFNKLEMYILGLVTK